MTTDPGFAPIFHGWNVWDVYQKNDLDFHVMELGLEPERILRMWVENATKDAPGAAVADSLNPAALVGDQVELIPSAGTLEPSARKESVPGPAMTLDGPATLYTVRFYNRGAPGELAWPHDSNQLLNTVYAPSTTSAITSGPPPSSLAGSVSNAADKAGDVAKTVLVVVAGVGGVLGLLWLLSQLNKGRRLAA